jgi:anti-anti-sigma factor
VIESCNAVSSESRGCPIAAVQLVICGSSEYLLRVCGELDLSTCVLLKSAFRSVPTDAADLVVDLESVSFVDLRGLQSIISVVADSRERGCRVHVTHADRALRLANLVGLGDVFEQTRDDRADQGDSPARPPGLSASVIPETLAAVNANGRIDDERNGHD